MNKLFTSTVFAIAILFAGISFAADVPAAATSADNKTVTAISKVSERPEGVIANSLVADAPLPSDYVLGSKDAKVIMIEYASLSCPHCAHFFSAIMPEIQKKYIDTGKIRYVLRQYPLNEPALRGAMLVNCVGEQSTEKYYLFNKVLFDSQSKWAFDGNWQSALETIAGVGGVSKEQFAACINNTDREKAVLKAKKDAMDNLKIPHTPYFFIGGEAYNGDVTVPDLTRFIDAKLAKK